MTIELTSDLSDNAWSLLHELRLRGFLPASGDEFQAELAGAGFTMPRGQNVGLTPAGRTAHAAWARLTPGSPEEEAARRAYEAFLPLNVPLLKICTDWQLRPDGSPNDH